MFSQADANIFKTLGTTVFSYHDYFKACFAMEMGSIFSTEALLQIRKLYKQRTKVIGLQLNKFLLLLYFRIYLSNTHAL